MKGTSVRIALRSVVLSAAFLASSIFGVGNVSARGITPHPNGASQIDNLACSTSPGANSSRPEAFQAAYARLGGEGSMGCATGIADWWCATGCQVRQDFTAPSLGGASIIHDEAADVPRLSNPAWVMTGAIRSCYLLSYTALGALESDMFTNRDGFAQNNFRHGFIWWDGTTCHTDGWTNGWYIYLAGSDFNKEMYIDAVPADSPGEGFAYSGAKLVLDNNGGSPQFVQRPALIKPITPTDVTATTMVQWTQFDLDHSLLFSVDVEGLDGIRRNLIYGANASNRWGETEMIDMTGSAAGYDDWYMYTRNINNDYLGEFGIAAKRVHAFGISHYSYDAWDGDHGGTVGGVCLGACPPDTDFDTVVDGSDNCLNVRNRDQSNNDPDLIDISPPKSFDDLTRAHSDLLGDACDLDDDNDGLSDADEISGILCGVFTNPLVPDTDGDLFLDGPECSLGSDPTESAIIPPIASCGAGTDSDGDKLSDRVENCFYGGNLNDTDTDADGCPDGKEAASVNLDRKVSSIDLSQIAQNFITGGYPIPASAVNADFDINKDGKISSIDLSQVAQNFGECP